MCICASNAVSFSNDLFLNASFERCSSQTYRILTAAETRASSVFPLSHASVTATDTRASSAVPPRHGFQNGDGNPPLERCCPKPRTYFSATGTFATGVVPLSIYAQGKGASTSSSAPFSHLPRNTTLQGLLVALRSSARVSPPFSIRPCASGRFEVAAGGHRNAKI